MSAEGREFAGEISEVTRLLRAAGGHGSRVEEENHRSESEQLRERLFGPP